MNKLTKLAAQQEKDKTAMQYPEGSFLAGGLPKNQSNALAQAASPQVAQPTPQQPANTAQAQPQQPAQQSQGKPYNGTVTVNGKQVQVNDGIAEFNGKRFFISTDGGIVMDESRHVIGRIENGTFKPVDEQQIADLKAKGLAQ